ncbi:serine hydrolase domain-containing protein [Fodinibius salinus]|nr:serine hydrolase domain-containing protein [Fodinibius salinus]
MKKVLFVALILLLFSSSGFAQTPWPDSTALDSYMDGLVNTYMEENDIAGATLGIIKDGEPILLKGYGYADVSAKKKVRPDSTLFRIGSISKMFVWTAVMQLVENDQLELDTDITQYIEDFEIPATFDEPITMKDLMTHTAGFEEYLIGVFARDSTKLRPLGEILSDEMPARVRPPATYASYSNHGTGIAAYIVEQVSGMQFEEYVAQHILNPLQMTMSTFRQPLPDTLQPYLSKGYVFRSGDFKEKGFEYVPLGPVGAGSATAADMLNFMQAHLRYGQFGEASILDSVTARQMQQPAFRHHATVNPMRHGFIDISQNGVEVIGHGGDTFWFHSTMALFPKQNIGLFLSFNSAKGGSVTQKVLTDFVDHYFPQDELVTDTLDVNKEYLQRFEGSYRGNRYPHERLTYMMALFNSQDIILTNDGMLKTMSDGEASYWFPVDSLTFRNTDNANVITFEENSSGNITHAFLSNAPIIALERVSFFSSQNLHFTLFGLAGAAFLITVFYWPLAYGIRRKYRPTVEAKQPLAFPKKLAAWTNALIILLFFGWVAILMSSGNGEAIVYGISSGIKVSLILPIISILLTTGMGYYTYVMWKNNESGTWSRICYTLLFVFSVTMLWQLYYWNLLGWQY